MARKSRKNQVQPVPFMNEPAIRAALYIRLSVEDTKSGSSSIETQKMILERYLEGQPEIFVYDTYIDNGATGTNFRRSGFQRMLSDIEAGHVNCVIVKDLSRLGRNCIDTGYYIEQYFPQHRVRFIAITDQYDSNDPDDIHAGIILPLKNMINEAYALDIGRKIKAQQRQAMRDGEFVGSRPPYGYLKAPDDCHKLVVDPNTAPVVRQMFEWAAAGAGLNTIVVRLNAAKILPPSQYKKSIGQITHENLMGNGSWQTRTVAKILHREIYTGDLVQGHTKTVDHRQMQAGPDKSPYYICRHSLGIEGFACNDMKIPMYEVEEAVFEMIKKQASLIFPDGIKPVPVPVDNYPDYECQISEMQEQKLRLYERYVSHTLDLDSYRREKDVLDALILKTRNTLAAAEAQVKQAQERHEEMVQQNRIVQEINGADGLTQKLADLLIDRVYVFPDKRIEISYKIKDIFET